MKFTMTKTAHVNFGRLTMKELRDFVDVSHELPDEAVIDVKQGDSQMDGPWCTFTITEKS